MKNPYEILGISSNASDEEVKRRYYELARKYHPDNCQDDSMKAYYAEKMKEINLAYETINSWRASGEHTAQNGDSFYQTVRRLLNENRIAEADRLLESVSYTERHAEWLFLKGVMFTKMGRYFDALNMLEAACREDPGNPEYRDALNAMRNATANMRAGGSDRHSNAGCSNCDICSSLLCADCCCECMGGDLIRCC